VSDRQRVDLFAGLAGIAFAISAPVTSDHSLGRGVIALPMLTGAIFLFVVGYYAGLSRKH
jgi:hypothetical protein